MRSPRREFPARHPPDTSAPTGRHPVLLVAASALVVRDRGGARYGETELIGDFGWLSGRLGGGTVLTAAERESTDARRFAVAGRYRDHRLFDLTARLAPGRGGQP